MINLNPQLDFTRPVDQNYFFTKADPRINQIAKAVITVLNLHPVGRKSLSAILLLTTLRELLQTSFSPNKTTAKDSEKIKSLAFKISMLSLSLIFPFEQLLINAILNLVTALSDSLKTSFDPNSSQKTEALSLLNLAQKSFYLLSLLQKFSKGTNVLQVWQALSLLTQGLRDFIEVQELDPPPVKGFLFLFSFARIVQSLTILNSLIPDIKKEKFDYLKLLYTTSVDSALLMIITLKAENSALTRLSNFSCWVRSLSLAAQAYSQMPATIVNSVTSALSSLPKSTTSSSDPSVSEAKEPHQKKRRSISKRRRRTIDPVFQIGRPSPHVSTRRTKALATDKVTHSI